MKKELNIEQQVEEATADLQKAMLANIKANRKVIDSTKEKQSTHFAVVKASQRLRSLEEELMSI